MENPTQPINDWLKGIFEGTLEGAKAVYARIEMRDRVLGFAALVVGLGWSVAMLVTLSTPTNPAIDASIATTDLILVEGDVVSQQPEELAAIPTSTTASVSADEPQAPAWTWKTVTVAPGQSLDRIFKQLGLSSRLVLDLVQLDERTAELVTIKPGDVFHFAFDDEGQFRALKGVYDESRWLVVEQSDEGELASSLVERQMEYRLIEAAATIDSSLFAAAKEANLTDNMTMKLANVFGWDIDFALDIRQGDRFSLLYEEIWRDGEYLRDGPILAARFVNRGDIFEAIRFDTGDGADYFDPSGRRMKKAFLRAPLNFSRVTSNFNPNRFHPITRQVRPHNGTDYGAAPGTPVWSAGDGVVIESNYNRINGHYVFVQHGNQIITRYLHLKRRDVKRGERVSQGQTIGTVGSTGLATGAHLHYEFLVNGVHRDPRTVELPTANPLPDIHRMAFNDHAERLIERLNRFDAPNRLLASTSPKSCDEQAQAC